MSAAATATATGATPVWATGRVIRETITVGLPAAWLTAFAARHGEAVRKVGDARNATVMFRVADVLAALDAGEVAR